MKAKKVIGLAGAVFLGASMGIITSQSAWADTVTDFETVNGQLVVSTSIDGQSKTMADGSEIRKDGERWYNDFGEVTITYNETVEKDVPVGQSIPTEVLEPSLEQIETFPPVVTQTIETTVSNLETTSNLPQPDLQTPEMLPPAIIEEKSPPTNTQPPVMEPPLSPITEGTVPSEPMKEMKQLATPLGTTENQKKPDENHGTVGTVSPSVNLIRSVAKEDSKTTGMLTADKELITPMSNTHALPKMNGQQSSIVRILGILLTAISLFWLIRKQKKDEY